eukprot:Rmarinus@m.10503
MTTMNLEKTPSSSIVAHTKGLPFEAFSERCLNLITDACLNLMYATGQGDARFHNKQHLRGWFNRCILATSPHVVICGMILVERVLRKIGSIDKVCRHLASIPVLYFVSIMIASKSLYDLPYSNQVWVIIGEDVLTLSDLNVAELELLTFVDWRVHVPLSEFDTFVSRFF